MDNEFEYDSENLHEISDQIYGGILKLFRDLLRDKREDFKIDTAEPLSMEDDEALISYIYSHGYWLQEFTTFVLQTFAWAVKKYEQRISELEDQQNFSPN